MTMLKLPLVITLVTIMAVLAIRAMAKGVINMPKLGIQLKGTQKLAQWC